MSRRRGLGAGEWLTAAAFGAIALATLRPSYGAPTHSPWCLVCGDSGVLDVLLNIILFLPLGAGLALSRVRTGKALAVIVGTTLMVELLQYRLIVGRDGTLSDVLTNTLGGALGLAAGPHVLAWLQPAARLAARLSAVWAAGCVVLWTTMGFALQRSVPGGSYGFEWSPAGRPKLDVFPGRVLSLRVNDRPLRRDGPPSDALRASLTDSMRIEAVVVPGAPPRRTAAIAVISRDTDEVALLGQRRTNAVFGVRVRATDWRLKTPQILLEHAVPAAQSSYDSATAEPVRLVGTRTSRRFSIHVEGEGQRRSWSVVISPTLAWVLFLPFDYSLHPGYRIGTVLWVAGLLAPIGYWSAWTASGRRPHRAGNAGAWIIPVATPVVLLGVVPALFGLHTGAWYEWLAAAVGLAAGWALGMGARWWTAVRRHAGEPRHGPAGHTNASLGRSRGAPAEPEQQPIPRRIE